MRRLHWRGCRALRCRCCYWLLYPATIRQLHPQQKQRRRVPFAEIVSAGQPTPTTQQPASAPFAPAQESAW